MFYIAIAIIVLVGVIVCIFLFVPVDKAFHEMQIIKARDFEINEFYNG